MAKRTTKADNMKCLSATIAGMIGFMIIVLIVALLLIKLLWAWVVPDLFPGAVALGLIASTISWYTAFKVALVIGLFACVFRASHPYCSCNCAPS